MLVNQGSPTDHVSSKGSVLTKARSNPKTQRKDSALSPPKPPRKRFSKSPVNPPVKDLQCWVSGVPRSKGSFNFSRRRRKTIVRPADPHLYEWEDAIREAITPVWGERELSTVPFQVSLVFYFMRPKSSKRRFPSVKPDIDKITRAVLDPLTGIVYKDDCQVISLQATELYIDYYENVTKEFGESPGVLITLTELE